MSTPVSAATVLSSPHSILSMAYLRRSKDDGSGKSVSHPMQINKVCDMAAKDGNPEPFIFSDWNRSGRKLDKRTDYAEMLEVITAPDPRPKVLYSYSLSRLGRRAIDVLNLFELCRLHNVRVRLGDKDVSDIDFNTMMGKLLIFVMAIFAEWEGEQAVDRSLSALAVRRQRGDDMGEPGFGKMAIRDSSGKIRQVKNVAEDLDQVLDIFREIRTLTGAARKLNDLGVKPRRGGKWRTNSLRNIVEREAPELLPTKVERGVKPAAPFALFRLLRCHCGRFLTASRDAKGYIRYRCQDATANGAHAGAKSVQETALLDAIRYEASLLKVPAQKLEAVAANEAAIAAVRGRMKKDGVKFDLDEIDELDYRTRINTANLEIARLESATRAVRIPQAIDWSASAEVINADLRAIWSHVQLNDALRFESAAWSDPTMRDVDVLAADAHALAA